LPTWSLCGTLIYSNQYLQGATWDQVGELSPPLFFLVSCLEQWSLMAVTGGRIKLQSLRVSLHYHSGALHCRHVQYVRFLGLNDHDLL
jgi:hypothetical protein